MQSLSQKAEKLHSALWISGQKRFAIDVLHKHYKDANELTQITRELECNGLMKITTENGQNFFSLVHGAEQTETDSVQKQVYSLISASGRDGLEKRVLILKTKMGREKIDACLKSLESEQHIKSIRTRIGDTSKILYLQYRVSPAEKYNENSWTQVGTFQLDAARQLQNKIWLFIVQNTLLDRSGQSHARVTLESVVEHLNSHLNEYQAKEQISLANALLLCRNLYFEDRVTMVNETDYAATWNSYYEYVETITTEARSQLQTDVPMELQQMELPRSELQKQKLRQIEQKNWPHYSLFKISNTSSPTDRLYLDSWTKF